MAAKRIAPILLIAAPTRVNMRGRHFIPAVILQIFTFPIRVHDLHRRNSAYISHLNWLKTTTLLLRNKGHSAKSNKWSSSIVARNMHKESFG